MSDAPGLPEPHPAQIGRGASFAASFAASFVVCVASPWLGMISGYVGGFFLSMVLWGIGLIAGLVLIVTGNVRKDAAKRTVGLGILAGTLVAAAGVFCFALVLSAVMR